jgi:glutamine amidotransferase
MKIAIIDHQAGNLGNIQKSLKDLGCCSEIISLPVSLAGFDGILLPGVGSFKKAMQSLNNSGLSEIIYKEVSTNKMPILGICLGMQLLCSEGNESGFIKGLGLLEASVEQFDLSISKERIPHMGWNNTTPRSKSILFKNIPKDADFYFAHSYHVQNSEKFTIAATCNYGYEFPAAIEKDNVFATQFHPEKSQRYGRIVLSNFLDFCNKNMEIG